MNQQLKVSLCNSNLSDTINEFNNDNASFTDEKATFRKRLKEKVGKYALIAMEESMKPKGVKRQ